MNNFHIEQNTVKKFKKFYLFWINYFLEIVLCEKRATDIEIAEDAFGEEVYYNYSKLSRKLIDETDLDEERV